MSRFYADIQGARGMATRQGTPTSGIKSHTRGWDVGVHVECKAQNGEDVCYIYITGGSTAPNGKLLAIVTKEETVSFERQGCTRKILG